MKRFEDLTIKQVKKEIVYWETNKGTEAKTIVVHSISQDPDEDMYEQGDGHWCEQFYATVEINDELFKRGYEWDTESEDILSSWGYEENNDNDDLPENVVARLDYAGQALDTLELDPNDDVDIEGKLPVTVTSIRMDYPFPVERGSYNVYDIAPANTWGELLTETIKVFQREYNAGKADQMPHALSDYIIERIDIHPSPSHLATICIGS